MHEDRWMAEKQATGQRVWRWRNWPAGCAIQTPCSTRKESSEDSAGGLMIGWVDEWNGSSTDGAVRGMCSGWIVSRAS